MRKYLLISILYLVFILFGCNSHEKKGGNGDELNPNRLTGTPGYSEIREYLLKPNCLSCHSGMVAPNISNYELVKANLAAIQSSTIDRKTMPKSSPVSEDLQKLLKNWIEAGAPLEGKLTNPPVVVGPKLSEIKDVHYADINKFVLGPKCVGCHGEGSKLMPLDKIEIIRDFIDDIVDSCVTNDRMPPPPQTGSEPPVKNENALTQDEKDLLLRWVNLKMQD